MVFLIGGEQGTVTTVGVAAAAAAAVALDDAPAPFGGENFHFPPGT